MPAWKGGGPSLLYGIDMCKISLFWITCSPIPRRTRSRRSRPAALRAESGCRYGGAVKPERGGGEKRKGREGAGSMIAGAVQGGRKSSDVLSHPLSQKQNPQKLMPIHGCVAETARI